MFSPHFPDLWSTSLETLPRVWAYLDPGAGSMLLQIVLAGVMSSLFFMKSWVRQIREFLPIKSDKG